MDLRNGQVTIGEIFANPQARRLLEREFPVVKGSPLFKQFQNMPLSKALSLAGSLVDREKLERMIVRLRQI